DKSKISKRKHPVSINYYRDAGILPKALLNFLGQMGWSFGGDREKFTLEEMVSVFSWDRVSLGGPTFNIEKLTDLNQKYIQELDIDQLVDAVIAWKLNPDYLARLLPLAKNRIKKLSDLVPLTEFFFSAELDYRLVLPEMVASVPGVAQKEIAKGLLDFVERFEAREGWDAAMLDEVMKAWVAGLGWSTKHAYSLLRLAITARPASPQLTDTLVVLGKEITRRRLRQAAELIAKAK
ncbi:MAG: glutamate--tRNA ligase family protein, partial [Kofleriaceae bacterium]